MLDPGVEYTILSPTARMIISLHLLPLLSDVACHADANKMTPSNLAVCFAPILLRGPDPMEDVKMSAIIRKILTAMIEQWSEGLAPALGLTNEILEASLKTPEKPEDREDPLDEAHPTSKAPTRGYGAMTSQVSGITLQENDASSSSEVPIEADDSSDDDSDTEIRPPLPPRPSTRSATDPLASQSSPSDLPRIGSSSNITRKPAPVIQTPPRYSTVVTDQAAMLARVNQLRRNTGPTNTVEYDGVSVHRNSVATLPPYEEMPNDMRQAVDEAMSSSMGGSGPEEVGGRQQRTPSMPTIHRKPVGEGKLDKREGEGV